MKLLKSKVIMATVMSLSFSANSLAKDSPIRSINCGNEIFNLATVEETANSYHFRVVTVNLHEGSIPFQVTGISDGHSYEVSVSVPKGSPGYCRFSEKTPTLFNCSFKDFAGEAKIINKTNGSEYRIELSQFYAFTQGITKEDTFLPIGSERETRISKSTDFLIALDDLSSPTERLKQVLNFPNSATFGCSNLVGPSVLNGK